MISHRLPPSTKHLKELAKSVGMKLYVIYDGDMASAVYRLFDRGCKELVMEYDHNDMIDSIKVYAGGHAAFKDALAQYNYATGEDW